MVWNQYVYEADIGTDVHMSDDEHEIEDTIQTIDDWEHEYHEVLVMMWNTIRTLLHDSHITHSGNYWDFVNFCFTEHVSLDKRVCFEYEEQTTWFEVRIANVWKSVKRIKDGNGLHEELMRGATFWNFMIFCRDILCVR